MNNNRLLNTLNSIVDYFLLNLIWVIVSLPLITFFPATAALFGVIRKRQLEKESKGIIRDFYTMFKENFKHSIGISFLWTLVATFLYVNYLFIQPDQSVLQLLLYIVLVIAVLLFSAITSFLFPIMVHFELSWKLMIKNAFFFSLMFPVLTLLLLVTLGIGGYLLFIYPVLLFAIGSPMAYVMYYLCQSSFNQVIAKQDSTEH